MIRNAILLNALLLGLMVSVSGCGSENLDVKNEVTSSVTTISDTEIGEKLYYSYSYVKKIVASLKDKLDAGNTNELIRKLRN